MNHSTDHLFHSFSEQPWKDSPSGTEDETTEERMFRVFPDWWQGLLAEDEAWRREYTMISEKRYPDYYYDPMGNNPLVFAVQSMTTRTLPAQSMKTTPIASDPVGISEGKILNKRSQELLQDLTTPSSGTTWLVGEATNAGSGPPTTTTPPQSNTGIEHFFTVLERLVSIGFSVAGSVGLKSNDSDSDTPEIVWSFRFGMPTKSEDTNSE